MSGIRAQKGGEVGNNGFWYEGGQFLPKTKLSKMTKRAQKEIKTYTSKKQEIAPYVWECPPDISVRSLWTLCQHAFTRNQSNQLVMMPAERIEQMCVGMGWGEKAAAEITAQAHRWVNGERWISQNEEPFFWWTEVKNAI